MHVLIKRISDKLQEKDQSFIKKLQSIKISLNVFPRKGLVVSGQNIAQTLAIV